MVVVCVFGDSIAWGAGDFETGGWVARLNNHLQKTTGGQVYNCGIRGDDTNGLLQRFEVEGRARAPDVVIFAIGINDSEFETSGRGTRVKTEAFRKNIGMLIDKAKKITNKIAYVGLTRVDESKTTSIPGEDIEYRNDDISRYDAAIEELCKANHITYVKMADVLKSKDLDDGLHPNSAGHEKMFERVRDVLSKERML